MRISKYGLRTEKGQAKEDDFRYSLPFFNDLWKLNKEELWIEINEKRNMIVHSDEIVELSEEQFASYLFYFERIMLGIAVYAKYYQGVNIIFAKFNEQIPEKGKPIFKP